MVEEKNINYYFSDDVPPEVKQRRLKEVIDLFYQLATEKNESELNQRHIILIEKNAKKDENQLMGRTDTNKKVIIPKDAIPLSLNPTDKSTAIPQPGDYVAVDIVQTGFTLQGKPLAITTLQEFANHTN